MWENFFLNSRYKATKNGLEIVLAQPKYLDNSWPLSGHSWPCTIPRRKPAATAAPPLADLTDEDLEKLTTDDMDTMTDDELFTVSARLRAKYEREGAKNLRPLLTNEELRAMTDELRDALANELREEIARSEQAAGN
jgi:hypothetical protein